MNILWIPNFLPFPIDNGGKVVIANRMQQVTRKHNIYMVAESPDIDDTIKASLQEVCTAYKLVAPVQRGMLHHLKWLILGTVNLGRYWNPGMTKAIESMLEQYQIDMINIDLPMVFVNLYPIRKKISNIPVVVNQHNIEFANVRSKTKVSGISPILKLYALVESAKLYRWEKKLYMEPLISSLSFVSDVDLALFRDSFHGRKNQELFHSPIGTNKPTCKTAQQNTDEKAIVFTASFDYPPNVHGAVWFCEHVMPLIRRQVKGAKLYLVGRNPKEEVVTLGCKDVIVTGTVDSVLPYLQKADIFVVPIFYGGGVKTKLIEMGCYGKPIVSSSSGCLGTIFHDGDDLLIRDEPDAFANACIDILINPGKYEQMCSRIQKKTEDNYLWKNIGQKYCSFLERQIK